MYSHAQKPHSLSPFRTNVIPFRGGEPGWASVTLSSSFLSSCKSYSPITCSFPLSLFLLQELTTSSLSLHKVIPCSCVCSDSLDIIPVHVSLKSHTLTTLSQRLIDFFSPHHYPSVTWPTLTLMPPQTYELTPCDLRTFPRAQTR